MAVTDPVSSPLSHYQRRHRNGATHSVTQTAFILPESQTRSRTGPGFDFNAY